MFHKISLLYQIGRSTLGQQTLLILRKIHSMNMNQSLCLKNKFQTYGIQSYSGKYCQVKDSRWLSCPMLLEGYGICETI